jgi:hypothetical protein
MRTFGLAVLPIECMGAQDPFEIHIYEYEPLSLNQYSLEAHLNFTPQGTSAREGSLLPTLNRRI